MTTMTYGSYEFSPVPFLTIVKEYIRSDAGKKIGALYKTTLDGKLTPIPGIAGYANVDALQDELETAMNVDGERFLVQCDSTTLIDVYPRVIDIQFSPTNDNWVQTAAFSITLEWDGVDFDTFSDYISSASESWTLEFANEVSHYSLDLDGTPDANPYFLNLSHAVSAKGVEHQVSGGLEMEAWQQARNWVVPRLGYDASQILGSGVFNFDVTHFGPYNHVRRQQLDEMDGTFSVDESWLVMNTGTGIAGRAIEDFTVSINKNIGNGLSSVDIQGQIQGLETAYYGNSSGDFDITENKYDAALDYWGNVQAKLLGRVQTMSSGETTRTINPYPISKVVGHNPPKGVISYGYQYDDRPCSFITGALSEDISIVDNHPTDVFASIGVLGRARGPILQSMNTVTSSTREVSINLVMEPPTGCSLGGISTILGSKPTAQVDALLCALEDELTSNYTAVYKTQDSESWGIKTGAYTRSVGWTFTSCTGVLPSTSFC